MPEPVYQRLRRYIDCEARLSRKQVALNAHISEPRLSLILSGKRGLQVDDYVALCLAIAVDPARFVRAETGKEAPCETQPTASPT